MADDPAPPVNVQSAENTNSPRRGGTLIPALGWATTATVVLGLFGWANLNRFSLPVWAGLTVVFVLSALTSFVLPVVLRTDSVVAVVVLAALVIPATLVVLDIDPLISLVTVPVFFLSAYGATLLLAPRIWHSADGLAPAAALLVGRGCAVAFCLVVLGTWARGLTHREGGGVASWSFLVAVLSPLFALAALLLLAVACTVARVALRRWPDRSVVAVIAGRTLPYTAASLIIVLSLLAGAAASWREHGTQVAPNGNPIEAGTPVVPLDMASDLDILAGLLPIIYLGEGTEPPSSIESILGRSTLRLPDGDEPLLSLAQLTALSCDRSSCAIVEFDGCAILDESCRVTPMDHLERNGPYIIDERVAVYTQVLRRGDHAASWDDSPFGTDLIGISQYWVFTPFDVWTHRGPAGVGTYRKSHGGDWESITVGWSDTEPLFVALSAQTRLSENTAALQIDTVQGGKQVLLRGETNAAAEWRLIAACHNLRKLFNHTGTARPAPA